MSRSFALVVVLVFAASARLAARADVIHLSSGDEIRGRVIRETADELIVEVHGGEARIRRSDVIRIERETEGEYLRAQAEDLRRLGALDDAIALYRRAIAGGDRAAVERLASAQRSAIERARARGDLLDAELRLPEAGSEARAIGAEIGAARRRAAELAAAGRKLVDKDPAGALESFRAALRIDLSLQPALGAHMARAAATRGSQVGNEGDFALAAALLEEAIAYEPSIRAHVAKSLAICRAASALERMRSGDLAAGILVLRVAADEDPAARLPRFYLAVALEVANEPVEAAGHYRAVLAGSAAPAPVAVDGLARLREAAAAACGELPIPPAAFLELTRFETLGGDLPVAASREAIEVCAADAGLAADVLASAERAAVGIAGWAGPDVRRTPVRIIVLETKARFREVTGQPEAVSGVTQVRVRARAGKRTIYTYATARDMVASVIPHEMTHALAMSAVPGAIPLWLNEGMAISSEPDAVSGQRVAGYRKGRAAGTALAIAEIVALDAYPQQDRIDSFYEGAAAFTSFLISLGGREKVFALAEKAAGTGAGGLEAGLREVFGFPDLARAMNAFEAWLDVQ